MSRDGSRSTTRVVDVASWAASLRLDEIPDDVIDLCRAQTHSVLAAIAGSRHDVAAGRVVAAVGEWAADGPAPLIGADRTVATDDAIYAASALSIALDFDDYVCFGHTGHSSVLIPIMAGAELGSTRSEQIVAQVIANEVGARLGGACLLGPLNGQLWSFLHAGAAALAAGRLLALDETAMAHALAIALTNAPRPTVPGFMAPDSKALTAAEPTLAGLRAARLAARGVTGPLDVLDDPHGFFSAFAYAALPSMLGGLGDGWATRTLSVKPYPGCAYIDTTVDALAELGPPPLDDVERVVVHGGLMTCGMDALSAPYSDADPTPVTVNFSIGWNVAIMLVAGRLTPNEVNAAWLGEHRDELASAAAKVELRHDWEGTSASIAAFAPLLPVGALVRDVGRRRLIRATKKVRADHSGIDIGLSDLVPMFQAGRSIRSGTSSRQGGFWSPEAIDSFAMTFPSRVEITLRSGRTAVATAHTPLGGAGNRDHGPIDAAAEKFATWASTMWGDEGAAAIDAAISDDRDLAPLLGGRFHSA